MNSVVFALIILATISLVAIPLAVAHRRAATDRDNATEDPE